MDTTALLKRDLQQQAVAFCQSNVPLETLMANTLSPKQQQAFHAAWMLEQIALKNITAFGEQHLAAFALYFVQITNGSAKRHYGKILHHLLRAAENNSSFAAILWQQNLAPVLDCCFDWLISDTERVAVKIYAMDCIFALGAQSQYAWARTALADYTDVLQTNATPAMQVRLKRLLTNNRKLL